MWSFPSVSATGTRRMKADNARTRRKYPKLNMTVTSINSALTRQCSHELGRRHCI
jgi:hypothetical protein